MMIVSLVAIVVSTDQPGDETRLESALVGYGIDLQMARCMTKILPGDLSAEQIERLEALPELPTHEATPADDLPWRLMALNDRSISLAMANSSMTCLQTQLKKP